MYVCVSVQCKIEIILLTKILNTCSRDTRPKLGFLIDIWNKMYKASVFFQQASHTFCFEEWHVYKV